MGYGDFGERRIDLRVTEYMFREGALSGHLINAVKRGQLDTVYAILCRLDKVFPGYLDGQDENDSGTALYWASCYGYEDVVRVLIDKGADVNRANSWRATPLHAAADNDHVRVCSLLIKNNANVNAQTAQGDTPCHLSAYRGCRGVVEKLLDAGADLSIRNRQNKTCLDEARGSGHTQIVSLMETYQYAPLTTITHNFAENVLKDRKYSDKCKTISACTDGTISGTSVVPSSCGYYRYSKPVPVCSQLQTPKWTHSSPYYENREGACHHSVVTHAHWKSSRTGSISEYEADIPNSVKSERCTSDSDLSANSSGTAAHDISFNINSVDYEEMKDKRYSKDLRFK